MGNELKLSLENFQSISHGELIFHAGTNVIIGQSNSGKTATFRALKACLSNPAGSQRFIKKGTNKSSVILEYNGNQIIWKRTPKESSYTINGEDFLKTGKSNAFKIVDDTGFVLEDDVIMNIEEELQLPFPFGIPKSELFKLYENVFCVSDSAVILKAAKMKEEDTKTEIANLENEIAKSKNKLTEIGNFKKEVNIKFLKEKRDYFKENLKRISFLKDGLDTIRVAAKVEGFSVQELAFTDMYSDLQSKRSLKSELCKLKKLHELNKSLKEIAEPTIRGINAYNELKELKKTYYTIKELQNVEAPVADFLNKLQNYEELKNYARALQNLKEKIKDKKEELKRAEELIGSTEKSMKDFKVCPLCHKPLD